MVARPFQLDSATPVGWARLDQVKFEAGDVVFVRGRGWLSRMILRFSRETGETRTFASHVGMVLVSRASLIIEALSTVVVRSLKHYQDKASVLVVRIPYGLLVSERSALCKRALGYRARRYGYLKIVAHAFDHLFAGDRYVFRRLAFLDRYPICSWLVAHAYESVLDYRFGADANVVSPDDMLDHCWVREWELVWADSYRTVRDFTNTA